MDLDRKVRQIWITYCARFNAAARLRRRAVYETWLVPILSVVILTLNVAQLMPFTSNRQTEIVIFTIFGSLLTVVIGLIWRPSESLSRARSMDECALEMKALSIHIEMAVEADLHDQFLEHYSRYNDIEAKYNLNHDHLDHERVTIWKEPGRLQWIQKIWFHIRYYFRYHCGYHLIVVIALSAAVWILLSPSSTQLQLK